MLTLGLFVQLQTCKSIVHLELHVTLSLLFLLFSEILQCNRKFLIVALIHFMVAPSYIMNINLGLNLIHANLVLSPKFQKHIPQIDQ